MSSDNAGSSQLRLSGFSSHASVPSGHRSVRARKNKQSALRSRARKKAYTEVLEKEVQGLLEENLKLKRLCKQEQKARDVAGGSRQLAAEPERLQLPRLHLQHHPPTCSPASLSLGIGTGGEEQLVVSSEDGHGHRSVRARKNKLSSRARKNKLSSRARKKAYTQELETELQGLLQDNLKLKRKCKQLQLQSEIAAPVGQQPSNKQSSPRRRTSST